MPPNRAIIQQQNREQYAMYLISDRTPAGKALQEMAKRLTNSGEDAEEWPRLVAETLDLWWTTNDAGGQYLATLDARMPGQDDDQRVPVVQISAHTEWDQGQRKPLYTAEPLASQQAVGEHPEGRWTGIKARIMDELDESSPRRLKRTQAHNPEKLMIHMQQTTIEAVMRMAHGLTPQIKRAQVKQAQDEQNMARQMAEQATQQANRQSAQNRADATREGAANVLVETVKCSQHTTANRCRVMMDGKHRPPWPTAAERTAVGRTAAEGS